MKTVLIVLSLLVLPVPGVYCASASPPRTPKEFIAAYRAAMEDRDLDKLKILTYTVGMSEEDKRLTFMDDEMGFPEQEIERVALEPLPEDYQDVWFVSGMKIESTSPPEGMIKVYYRQPEERVGVTTVNHSTMPYTIVDGIFFLVGTKSTDLQWEGPPDRTIGFSVRGEMSDRVKVRVKWNSSGIDQEREYSSNSVMFSGQHIDQVTVTTLDDRADIILEVLEEGEVVYTSDRLRGKGTIQYQR